LSEGNVRKTKDIRTLRFVFCAVFFFLMVLNASSFAGPPERIVSLAPGMTEILYALGLGDRLVGVTVFCDYPPEAKEKPKIGGMTNPSLEAVFSSEPDMVVMTTDGNPKEFESRLRSLKIESYVFRARRIYELPDALRELGVVLGVDERAEELAGEIENTLEEFKKEKDQSRMKVLYVIWPEPLIVAGPNTAIDDTIDLLGHYNVVTGGLTYPKYSIEEVIRQMPDVILFGSGHENMKKLSEKILGRLKSTPAVRNKRVFYMSDSLYRLGPRVMEGIKEMAEIFRGLDDEIDE
jgi:iron complex transport system substrate-binding protein